MINANFTIEEDGFIKEVSVKGHAGFDEYGYDVVCASVSALLISTINALEEYVGLNTMVTLEEGYTKFEIIPMTEVQRIQSDALTQSLLLAFEGLSDEYEGFVEVDIKEE